MTDLALIDNEAWMAGWRRRPLRRLRNAARCARGAAVPVKRTTLALACLVSLAATTTGCARAVEEFRDAPIDERDDTPADIINFPDGFSNVATKCDGTTMVYVTKNSNGRALAVSPNHPECQR